MADSCDRANTDDDFCLTHRQDLAECDNEALRSELSAVKAELKTARATSSAWKEKAWAEFRLRREEIADLFAKKAALTPPQSEKPKADECRHNLVWSREGCWCPECPTAYGQDRKRECQCSEHNANPKAAKGGQ